jgi:hypothetical protein
MTETPRADQLPFFPRFFVAGAPRCGTTSISKYLSWHPEICFSRPKEVHYFNRDPDLSVDALRRNYLERYFSHFDAARHRVAGEGSVSYLYDPDAIRRILAIQPEARFIVAVRNPIDMLRSYHGRMLFLLDEDQADVATAWDLQDTRRRGKQVPRLCADPRRLYYREVVSLGKHLGRLFEVAGREHCRVIVAEDLRRNPAAEYQGLLRFVGVSDDLTAVGGGRGFPQGHRSKSYRWRWLHRILYKPPKIVFQSAERGELSRGVRPSRIKRLHKRLVRFNRVKGELPPLPPQLRTRLRAELEDDIRLLGELLGRDLSHWR